MGARTASISIASNHSASPHAISLAGTGYTTTVSLSPVSLTFGMVGVGKVSSAQAITLTNNGGVTLSIASINTSGDFAQTNNCPVSLPVGNSCVISITFAPTTNGTRHGALHISDSAVGSPRSVSLTGVGSVAMYLPLVVR